MPGLSVTAMVDDDTGLVEFVVHGSWGRPLHRTAHGLLHRCLAQHPAGLVLDLRGIDDPGAGSASLWLTAARHGQQMDPPVRAATCLTGRTKLSVELDGAVARRLLPAFPTVALARSFLATSRPHTDQVRLHLPPDPAAAAVARQVVTGALQEWGMTPLVPHARLVVSELVLNAAEHAGTPVDVLISRRGRGRSLHLAVVDGAPRLPEMRAGLTSLFDRGHGLRIVDAAVQAWGALPTRTGKMVWALLR